MTASSASQNKALVRRLYDEFVNERNMEVFEELVAENVIEHEEFPGLSPNREGVKQFFTMLWQAFPDLHFVVEDMIAEEDKVVSRLRIQGTHRGEFLDAPPTGNRLDVEAVDVFRLADGQIKEHWGISDTLSMMQQIEAVPS